jgi:hypothetical protein
MSVFMVTKSGYFMYPAFSYSAPFLFPFMPNQPSGRILSWPCHKMPYLAVDTPVARTSATTTTTTTEYLLARRGIMTEHNIPLPALTTSSVFAIRSSISIDAPKQKVWDILLDFSSYKEWCVSLCNSRPPSITKPSLLCTGTHICAAPFFSGSSVFFPSYAADPCELAASKRSSAMVIRSTSFPKQQHQAAVFGYGSTCHPPWTTRARKGPRRRRF